jgi:hypothetical protein
MSPAARSVKAVLLNGAARLSSSSIAVTAQ